MVENGQRKPSKTVQAELQGFNVLIEPSGRFGQEAPTIDNSKRQKVKMKCMLRRNKASGVLREN